MDSAAEGTMPAETGVLNRGRACASLPLASRRAWISPSEGRRAQGATGCGREMERDESRLG